MKINDLEVRHKQHIKELIDKHQNDYDLLRALYASAKIELYECKQKERKEKNEKDEKRCIIL